MMEHVEVLDIEKLKKDELLNLVAALSFAEKRLAEEVKAKDSALFKLIKDSKKAQAELHARLENAKDVFMSMDAFIVQGARIKK